MESGLEAGVSVRRRGEARRVNEWGFHTISFSGWFPLCPINGWMACGRI